jgi:large subunit ribosomal protein L9
VNAGPQGTLFGSVTATDIADELWRTRKIRVDRRKIALGDSIKRIGRYEVPIDVFQDVRVEVKTLVVPEGGELPPEEELQAIEEAVRAEEEAAKAAEGEESWSEELLEEEPEEAAEPESTEHAEPGPAPEVDAVGGTADAEDAPALPAEAEAEDLERS